MANQPSKKPEEIKQFAFGKKNYTLLLIGLALLVVGFLLMIGGKSVNPQVFNMAIFDFQRLTLAPIIILAGFVIGIYAIMRRPKSSD